MKLAWTRVLGRLCDGGWSEVEGEGVPRAFFQGAKHSKGSYCLALGSVTRNSVPWIPYQNTHNEKQDFEEKEIRFIIRQMKRTESNNLSKLCCLTYETKCPPFKGMLRDSMQSMWQNTCPTIGAGIIFFITWFTVTTSLKLYVLVDRGLLLSGQKEIKGRRMPG
jgi:hypothetical protein